MFKYEEIIEEVNSYTEQILQSMRQPIQQCLIAKIKLRNAKRKGESQEAILAYENNLKVWQEVMTEIFQEQISNPYVD